MHNYRHEIERPEDRAMFKFLWCDYFRDSDILDAHLAGTQCNTVLMTISSARDQQAEWHKFLHDYEKWDRYIDENAEKYIYILKFRNVLFFERKQVGGWISEYVNGRFKDSALLRKLQKKSDKKLWHLRIMTTDGLIDLVFGGFEIKKLQGRMNYSAKMMMEPRGLDQYTLERGATETGRVLPEEDFDRFLLLERMYFAGNPAAAQAARDCLDDRYPCGDAKPYAAYILGKIGGEEDIPMLMKLWLDMEKELLKVAYDYKTVAQHRQNVMDAIEMIRLRAEENSAGA